MTQFTFGDYNLGSPGIISDVHLDLNERSYITILGKHSQS